MTAFDPQYGQAVEIVAGIRRLTARNPGPFTFRGTNSYLIGVDQVVVVDPGPDAPDHVDDLIGAAGAGRIAAILITHTHRDHSPAARRLKALTGAPIIGAGPHGLSRPLHAGEVTTFEASADLDHMPDQQLGDGDTISLGGTRFEVIATPGHTANHLSFGIGETDFLLSGDHVMGWSTSVVAPPEGSMADYMRSLDRLSDRSWACYLPGHGSEIRDGKGRVAELRLHRFAREAAILRLLGPKARDIRSMVEQVYADTDRSLHGAAMLSMFAQLEFMVARGLVISDGPARLDGGYRLT